MYTPSHTWTTSQVVTVTYCLDYVARPVPYMEELLALMPPGSLLIVAEPLRIPVEVKLALDEAVGHDQGVVYNSRSDPDPRFSGKYFEWEHGTSRHKPQALEVMMTMNCLLCSQIWAAYDLIDNMQALLSECCAWHYQAGNLFPKTPGNLSLLLNIGPPVHF